MVHSVGVKVVDGTAWATAKVKSGIGWLGNKADFWKNMGGGSGEKPVPVETIKPGKFMTVEEAGGMIAGTKVIKPTLPIVQPGMFMGGTKL